MKANRLAKDEEGDFGIGTMIIFIALIVVAVVAATVILQVMYKLQSSAENTGDQAVTMVSSGVHIKSVLGDRVTSGFQIPGPFDFEFGGGKKTSEVQRLTILLELRAGSLPIDLDRTLLRVVTAKDVVEYAGQPLGAEKSRAFSAISSIRDNDDSIVRDHVLNHMGDVATVVIDVSDLGIGSGESFTMQIIPDVGGIPVSATVTMPLSYPYDAEQVELYP